MYQELIGELLYLANRTRPDISFVMSYLSQFNHNPEKRHYNLAKRVLRYLMGSKDKKLFYENGFGILNASSDASWGNAKNGKSFSGGVVLLDNQIKLLEIPSDLSCAYLKGHLLGRALDWYQIFGSKLVQITATDFTQLKAALSKAFPAIQNRKDLETRSYASHQRQNQEPTDFVYDLFNLNKKLELRMSEKALVDHIFVRLEPQVQDYVEVHNPQTAIQLFEVLAKFEERYSCKATLGSRNSNNVEGRDWNERRISNVGNNRGNWRNSEVAHRPNNGRNDYRGNYQTNRQGNQWVREQE
ncbi:uncharacterized protein TNCV_314261 [Trichonephila clavipes]|nr:uncharacterized protein TNCV_314261 [Trichonephila clavipes]